MESLIVKQIKYGILQDSILKYQTKLQNLSLYNCSLQQWLRNTKLPYCQLNFLTHLYISQSNQPLDLNEFLLSELTFPKLQSFSIRFQLSDSNSGYSTDSFFKFIRKLKDLRFLEIHWELNTDESYQRWFALCSSLPKLSYLLNFDYSSKLIEDFQYPNLCKIFPSLCIIICVKYFSCPKSSVKYFKDVGTNTIMNISITRAYDYYEGIPLKYLIKQCCLDTSTSVYKYY